MRARAGFVWWMLLPMIVVLVLFTVLPFVWVLWNSFQAYDLTQPDVRGFVGWSNFAQALAAPGLIRSAVITLIFCVVTVTCEFFLGVVAAALLWRPLAGSRLYLATLVLPFAATPVATYLAWRLMLNPAGGQVNALLGAVGLPEPSWTSSPVLALVSLIVVDVWQWTPFVTLIMLAGLHALPKEPFEAAALDGAGFVTRLRSIALGLLRPLAAFVIMFRTLDAFRTFDPIWMITSGGPARATETLTVRLYRTAFVDVDLGVAAALSLLMLAILLVIGRLFVVRVLDLLEARHA